jgi:hypothetical protein
MCKYLSASLAHCQILEKCRVICTWMQQLAHQLILQSAKSCLKSYKNVEPLYLDHPSHQLTFLCAKSCQNPGENCRVIYTWGSLNISWSINHLNHVKILGKIAESSIPGAAWTSADPAVGQQMSLSVGSPQIFSRTELMMARFFSLQFSKQNDINGLLFLMYTVNCVTLGKYLVNRK